MTREVTPRQLQRKLHSILDQVQSGRGDVLIRRDGQAVAALVDAELFSRIERNRRRFDELCSRIASSYASVPACDGLAEIDAAVASVRAGAVARHGS